MLPELTPDIMFSAFIFAAVAFTVMVLYARRGSRLLVILNKEIGALRGELKSTSDMLKDANTALSEAESGRNLLVSRIDRLIMRRDDLLTCLNAAETDEEKVACILKLMGTEENDGSMGS